VVVSTVPGKHGEKNVVPYPGLLWELGCRSTNYREYAEEDEHYQHIDGKRQPQRTDREPSVDGEQVRYVDLKLPAAAG
jgi:hypothetical protein